LGGLITRQVHGVADSEAAFVWDDRQAVINGFAADIAPGIGRVVEVVPVVVEKGFKGVMND